MRAPKLLGIVALAALATASCGDDGTTSTPTDELRLPPWVPDQSTTVQVVTADGTLADAGIVIETNTGQLIELVTGRDGAVTFDMPLEGVASLLAHKDDYAFGAISGRRLTAMLEDHEGIQLFLPRRGAPDRAWIAGHAYGMDSPGHFLTVTANQPGATAFQARGDMFAMQVETGQAFTLVGLEWEPMDPFVVPDQGYAQTFFNWAATSHHGIEDPAQVDLDFNQSLDVETRNGSFQLPVDSSIADDGRAYVRVTTLESDGQLFLGGPTLIDIEHQKGVWFEIPNRDPGDRPIIVWQALSAEATGGGLAPAIGQAPDVISAIRGLGHLPVGDLTVTATDDQLPIGLYDSVRVEYEVQSVMLPRIDDGGGFTTMTEYLAWDGAGNATFATERGAPVAGDSDITLPDLPVVDGAPTPSIHEAVVWSVTGQALPYTTVAVYNRHGEMVGTMMALSEEQATHCPPLPSSSNPDLVFSGALSAVLVSCTPSPALETWCARGTQSAPFAVVP